MDNRNRCDKGLERVSALRFATPCAPSEIWPPTMPQTTIGNVVAGILAAARIENVVLTRKSSSSTKEQWVARKRIGIIRGTNHRNVDRLDRTDRWLSEQNMIIGRPCRETESQKLARWNASPALRISDCHVGVIEIVVLKYRGDDSLYRCLPLMTMSVLASNTLPSARRNAAGVTSSTVGIMVVAEPRFGSVPHHGVGVNNPW